VEGVALRNSAFWTLHLVYSDQITVRGVKVCV
jgi:polygalacturonase